MMRSGAIDLWAQVPSLVILTDLAAVALCLGWGWRRGAAEARDFAAAWCLPMAVLAFINIVDVENVFWGAGSKLLVLLAATWQAPWLSAAGKYGRAGCGGRMGMELKIAVGPVSLQKNNA